jgi:hypothetical protein
MPNPLDKQCILPDCETRALPYMPYCKDHWRDLKKEEKVDVIANWDKQAAKRDLPQPAGWESARTRAASAMAANQSERAQKKAQMDAEMAAARAAPPVDPDPPE